MMQVILKYSLALLISLSLAACATQTTVPTSAALHNSEQAFATLQKQTHLPIIMPSYLPKGKTDYYAYAETIPDGYVINIDTTATCHGVKYCSAGYVQAIKGQQPSMQKDRKGKVITQQIKQNAVTYYYTPGHAMGDYFPAQLQWVKANIMYTVSFQTSKANMLKIASSCVSV